MQLYRGSSDPWQEVVVEFSPDQPPVANIDFDFKNGVSYYYIVQIYGVLGWANNHQENATISRHICLRCSRREFRRDMTRFKREISSRLALTNFPFSTDEGAKLRQLVN